MKAGRSDGRSIQHRPDNFLLTYRCTPHATTNTAPCILFMQRPLRTQLDLLIPNTEQQVTSKQVQGEPMARHDQHAIEQSFAVGQKMMAKIVRPGQGLAWVPERLTRQLGPVSYLVLLDNGRTWKRRVDHIRALKERPSKFRKGEAQPPGDSEFPRRCSSNEL